MPCVVGLLGEERAAGAARGFGDAIGGHREAGRVHLAQHGEAGSLRGGVRDERGEMSEVRIRVFPDDVVLDRGNLHGVLTSSAR